MFSISTHDNGFHADEVTAIALYNVFVSANYEVIRSRDESLIAKSDMEIDVGGAYNPSNLQFDHHQRDYTGELSSAGMIWEWLCAGDPRKKEYRRIGNLVADVDAQDTGRVKHGAFHYCNLISMKNDSDIKGQEQERAFLDAVAFAVDIIRNILSKDITEIENKPKLEAMVVSDEVATLADMEFIPGWQRKAIEAGAKIFLSFDDVKCSYTALTVPLQEGEFESSNTLSSTGDSSEVFCHKAGFISVVKEVDGFVTVNLNGELKRIEVA